MIRKLLIILLLVTVGIAGAAPKAGVKSLAADHTVMGTAFAPTRLVGLEDEIQPRGPVADWVPRDLDFAVAVGTAEVIGETWYDYQANGSIGKMIAVDEVGNIHIMWMKGYDAAQAGRHMNYNVWSEFKDGGPGWIAPYNNTVQVDKANRAGYGHVALVPVNAMGTGWQAVGVYHGMPNAADKPLSTLSPDFMAALGAFGEGTTYLSVWPGVAEELIWPKGAITNNLHFHITATENPPEGQLWHRTSYWHGTPADNDYLTWNTSPVPVEIGISGAITSVAASSPTSNKVVVAWHESRTGKDIALWDNVRGAWQRNNDIRYVVMNDGEEYNAEVHPTLSMSKIMPPDPNMWDVEPQSLMDPLNPDDIDEPYGDVWRPYSDVDIQFDPWEDNLYGSFATATMWERPWVDDGGYIIDGMTSEHNMLWFWNGELDTLTLLANGYYFNRTNNSDDGNFKSRCGGWRMNVDRPSIAFDPDNPGHIYVAYVQFPQIMEVNEAGNGFDYINFASDTSRAGFSNAEVMVSVSTDYGITWREPLNVTGTIWVGEEAPAPGECMSEAWMSLASKIYDGSLHLMYVSDTDAGGVAQEEGAATKSPVVYQDIPLAAFRLDTLKALELPYEGFVFHNYPQPRPELVGLPVRAPAAPTPLDEVTITAEFFSGGEGLTIDSAMITFFVVDQVYDSLVSLQAEQVRVGMVQTGVNGLNYTFSGKIPQALVGKSIWYTVWAKNSGGLSVTYPRGNAYMSYTVRPEGELTIRDVQYRFKGWDNDYSPYLGYEVTVSGIVTTPASYNERFGAYAIQDGIDIYGGLFVRGIAEDLAEGDLISVTGTIGERDPNDTLKWEYATHMDVRTYSVISTGNPTPEPIVITTPSLLFPKSEYYEGMLVHLWDLTVDDTLGKGEEYSRGYWPIRDNELEVGKFAWAHSLGLTDDDKDSTNWMNWATGSVFDKIVGILTENYGHYAVGPRYVSDIGVVSVGDQEQSVPTEFKLNSVYPNPFNGITRVNFSLPAVSDVRVSVYDLSGRLVLNVAERNFSSGHHSLSINAGSLATGVYILRVETPTTSLHQKMVLMK